MRVFRALICRLYNGFFSKKRIMPYCVAYGCDNDTHDAPREVSFHRLPLKKPALLKQVIIKAQWSVKLSPRQIVVS